MAHPLDPAMLMKAYAAGIFPMADSREAEDVYWVEPKRRGILPLEGFRLSRSLGKVLKSERFETTADAAFADVVRLCAEAAPDRDNTWINPQIEAAVTLLHSSGHAHSIETWADGQLVGGLYGIRLGRAFFGESMFSRATDASKVALAHLIARLRAGGFTLLDCQFLTPHLASLGAVEVSRAAYVSLLSSALSSNSSAGADFRAFDLPPTDISVTRATTPKRIVQTTRQHQNHTLTPPVCKPSDIAPSHCKNRPTDAPDFAFGSEAILCYSKHKNRHFPEGHGQCDLWPIQS